jgi:hypothetical protein
VKLALVYPASVAIPGGADDASVRERVTLVPAGFLSSPNDLDGRLVVAVAGTRALPPGPVLRVRLERCAGAPAPAEGELGCIVEEAADETNALLREGVGCAVEWTRTKEEAR